MTTLDTTQPIVTNDMTKEILAQYDGLKIHVIEWFVCSSAYSFQPKPGSGAKKLTGSGGEDILMPPVNGDLTLAAGTYDPDINYVIELDTSQISTCSCTYSFGRRIPAINLRRCRGAVLRNVIVQSLVQSYNPEDQFGCIGETVGSMGVFYPLKETELITCSVLNSLIGAFPVLNTSKSTVSLVYKTGSQSVFFKSLPKLTAKYYAVSLTTEQRLVMEVI